MLKPVRYDLYEKAINKQPKTKIDKRMITVEECLLFAEWLRDNYIWDKEYKGWVYRHDESTTTHTTRELWELYQKFLGKKPAKK